mmetsp:Transcript_18974/g.45762  ORF Transcript_18974/g.45762 Transcript_18974/m.45762 type:complete len:261 (+) Transcript_18974:1009-1791(+)
MSSSAAVRLTLGSLSLTRLATACRTVTGRWYSDVDSTTRDTIDIKLTHNDGSLSVDTIFDRLSPILMVCCLEDVCVVRNSWQCSSTALLTFESGSCRRSTKSWSIFGNLVNSCDPSLDAKRPISSVVCRRFSTSSTVFISLVSLAMTRSTSVGLVSNSRPIKARCSDASRSHSGVFFEPASAFSMSRLTCSSMKGCALLTTLRATSLISSQPDFSASMKRCSSSSVMTFLSSSCSASAARALLRLRLLRLRDSCRRSATS